MTSHRIAALVLAALSLGGCTQLEIFSDAGMKTAVGIPFYVQKPYLLVSRTGAKDKPIDISVIYINDLSQPRYARITPGLIGSSEITLAFSNSALTAVGQKSDAQLDELIGAYGGLATALATAGKTERETALLGNQSADYGVIGISLTAIAATLATAKADATRENVLTAEELQKLDAIETTVSEAGRLLSDPTQASTQASTVLISLTIALRNWPASISVASTATSGAAPSVFRNLNTAKGQLEAVIRALGPTQVEQPTFSLYEIDNSVATGGTVLRLVELGT